MNLICCNPQEFMGVCTIVIIGLLNVKILCLRKIIQTPSNKGAYLSPKSSNGGQVSKSKCQSV